MRSALRFSPVAARSRRVLVQAVKRSPFDTRRLLGIPQRDNAVGIANLLSAYTRATFLSDDERNASVAALTARLGELRLGKFDHPCWGYHFDVETRVFFYPSTRPNTIATAFAGQALLDAYEDTGDRKLLELAVGVGDFFLEEIGTTETAAGEFFGYFIGDQTPIHNANMLVCGLLARLLRFDQGARFRDACAASLAYCLAHQRADGSWPYGEQRGLEWVDGFHTGYVLDALLG